MDCGFDKGQCNQCRDCQGLLLCPFQYPIRRYFFIVFQKLVLLPETYNSLICLKVTHGEDMK